MLKISTNVPCTIKPNCCGCLHGYSDGGNTTQNYLWVFKCNECGAESGRGLESYVRATPAQECTTCGGSGFVDSGGTRPDMQPLDMPCPSCNPAQEEK